MEKSKRIRWTSMKRARPDHFKMWMYWSTHIGFVLTKAKIRNHALWRIHAKWSMPPRPRASEGSCISALQMHQLTHTFRIIGARRPTKKPSSNQDYHTRFYVPPC